MKKIKQQKTTKQTFGLKDAWACLWIILSLGVLGYFFVYNPVKWTIGKHYLKKEGILTKGIFISESVHRYHSSYDTMYNYQFSVANKYYTGNTSLSYAIGDSADIRYWRAFPSINMVDSECMTMGWNTDSNP